MDDQLALARSRFVEGIAHFEAGRLAEARSAFEAALGLAPDRPSIVANLGITLARLGEAQVAIPLLQKSTRLDPRHVDSWVCLGQIHESRGEWAAAAKALEQALALEPQHATLWVSRAHCQHRLGQLDAALHSFDRALANEPQAATIWSERGGLLRELHRLDEAAECFERALALGADRELNGYFLASVRGTGSVTAPPRRYVEALFDDYAADFQQHLVGQLGYRGFEVLLRPLLEAGRRYRRVLDLGCGTGLCGSLIQPQAEVVDGLDVSSAMLAEAARLGIYRQLIHADLGAFLNTATESADLVLAADVFIYVGELSPIFPALRRLLTVGGCLAFTVEKAAEGRDLELLPSLRYAHSAAYIRRLAGEAGFTVDRMFRAPIRNDQSGAVQGLYCYLS